MDMIRLSVPGTLRYRDVVLRVVASACRLVRSDPAVQQEAGHRAQVTSFEDALVMCRDLVALLREEGSGLNDARRAAAEKALSVLETRFGYQRGSAGDAAVSLVRERFADVY